MTKVTPEQLLAAIRRSDEEKHPSIQAFIDDEYGLPSVILDGSFDLERIVEILSGDPD